MAKKGPPLDRILRVRTLQLNMKRAEEMQARAKMTSEQELRHRIRELTNAVSPTQTPAAVEAFSFVAAAHFRERLHQSATAADHRLRIAEDRLDAAAEATREARRDQNAVEKLIERDAARDALKAIRALEEFPAVKRNRHDPC